MGPRVTELDPDDGQDDLDAYLATLTEEERQEVDALFDVVEIEIIEHDA